MKVFPRIVATAVLTLPLIAVAQSTGDAQLQTLMAQLTALKAQLAALQQTNSPTLSTSAAPGVQLCLIPERTLQRGDEGTDVTSLQIYLARDKALYPEGAIVGVYGPATARAVGRWQKKYGVVSAGTSATSGFGSVGPRTLSLMQKVWDCSGPVTIGWFSGNTSNNGSILFSAQTDSTYPLDASLSVNFGDGASSQFLVSSSICKTLGGPCSSLLAASHAYAGGTFTAMLRQTKRSANCVIIPQVCGDGVNVCASLPPICTPQSHTTVLATTTIVSSGAAAAGTTISGTAGVSSSASSVAAGPPSARILAPIAGTAVQSGGSLSVSWMSVYAPSGATAVLVLKNASTGAIVGTIVSGQKTSGSYWWTLPVSTGSACTADAFTCLSQLAVPTCSGGLCSVPDGLYSIIVRIVSGGTTVASAESGKFAVGSLGTIPAGFGMASSSAGSGTTVAASSSYSYISSIPANSSVASLPQSCLYSGIQYGDGITLEVGCTDVAGMSCGGYGGQSLTCKGGQWYNGAGGLASIPNVTNFSSSGSSCTTPWGSQVVQSGRQITYEPFFTGGNYTGTQVVPLMQCTNGSWQKCNWDGTGCKAFIIAN